MNNNAEGDEEEPEAKRQHDEKTVRDKVEAKCKADQEAQEKKDRDDKEACDKLEAKCKADQEAQEKKDHDDKEAHDKLEAKCKADQEAQEKKDHDDKEACDKLEAKCKADQEAQEKKEHDEKEAHEKLEAQCKADEKTEGQKEGEKIITEVKEEKGLSLTNLPYNFDEEGLPIWAEKELPNEKMTQKPPGWEQDKWEKHLHMKFNTIRKNAFNKLYNSCKRKHERCIKEEEAECHRKEEEKRHAEEQRRVDRQWRAKELEEEADQMLHDEFELSWKELGIDISKGEDEEDGGGIPEKDKQNGADNSSLKNGTKVIKSESDNEVEMKTLQSEVDKKKGADDIDEEDINGIPQGTTGFAKSFGTNAEDESASSTLSGGGSGQTPTQKSMHLQSKNITLKLNQRSQLSTTTIQILSNLFLTSALEIFQGVKFGTQDDMELLKNLCVLQALREFYSSLGTDVTLPPHCLQLPLKKKNLTKRLCRILCKRRVKNAEQNVNQQITSHFQEC